MSFEWWSTAVALISAFASGYIIGYFTGRFKELKKVKE